METVPNYVSQVEQLSAQFQRSETFLNELLNFSRDLENSSTPTYSSLEHLVQPLLSSLPSIKDQLAAIMGKLEEIEEKFGDGDGDGDSDKQSPREKLGVEAKEEIESYFDANEDFDCGTFQQLLITPDVPKKAPVAIPPKDKSKKKLKGAEGKRTLWLGLETDSEVDWEFVQIGDSEDATPPSRDLQTNGQDGESTIKEAAKKLTEIAKMKTKPFQVRKMEIPRKLKRPPKETMEEMAARLKSKLESYLEQKLRKDEMAAAVAEEVSSLEFDEDASLQLPAPDAASALASN